MFEKVATLTLSRHTSRLDRQIVDSTKCQVSRVRFGYKEGRGLIVVYTGIDQFLRIEMEDTEKGILITKFENSFDPEKARPPFIMKKEPEKPCLIILLQMTYFFLIINPKIHIKVLEMEIPELAANDPVRELLDGVAQTTVALGQVDELVFCGLGNHTISSNVMALAKDCKKSFIQLMITHDNIGLTRAYDNLFVRKNGSFTDTFLIVSTERHEPGSPNLDLSYNQQCKEQLKDKDKSVLICSLRNLNDRNPKECSRKTNGELVQWSKTTECGQVKRTIRKIHEEDCKQQLESTECGLGDLCKRCSDPFDYWYTQNLPRRLYFEPFWDGFVYIPHNFSEQSRCHIQNLKSKIAQYEKEKQRIRKIVEKKKGKNQVASWGFGKEHRGWEEYVMKSVIKGFKEKEILDEIGIEKWPTASSLEADLEKIIKFAEKRHPEKIAELISLMEAQQGNSEPTKPLEIAENERKESKVEDAVPLETEQSQTLEGEEEEEDNNTEISDCHNSVGRRLKLLAMVFLFPIILSFVISFFLNGSGSFT